MSATSGKGTAGSESNPGSRLYPEAGYGIIKKLHIVRFIISYVI